MSCFIDFPLDEYNNDGGDFAKADTAALLSSAVSLQFGLQYLKDFWLHSIFYEYDGRLTIRFSFKEEKQAMIVKMGLNV